MKCTCNIYCIAINLALLAILVGMRPATAYAAGSITVDRTDDPALTASGVGAAACTAAANDCSLRGATLYANAHPGTTINMPAGTYQLTIDGGSEGGNCLDEKIGDLDIAGNNTSIVGAGAAATIIQQTRPNDRVICVDQWLAGNFNFSISGVTITGGRDTFGVCGGGMVSGYPGDVTTVTNVVFSNNRTSGIGSPWGGGLCNGAGALIVSGTTFDSNQASGQGGGLYYSNNGYPDANTLSLDTSTFSNNVSGANGGGLLVANTNSAYTVTRNTFTNNTASGSGNAIYNVSGTLNASYNRFVNPAAGNDVYANAGVTNITNNWWGCNGGPGAAGCNTVGGSGVTYNPWIILKTTANPATINSGQSTTLTASVLQNSNSGSLTTAQVAALVGVPVTWTNAVSGSFSGSQVAMQANGMATATFTHNGVGCGAAGGQARIDNVQNGDANATVTIGVICPTTVISLNRLNANPNKNATVTWQIVFADPVSGLTAGNFALANTGLGGSPAITAVTATSGPPSTTWNITSNTGSGNGTLGLNMVNATGLSLSVTNASFTGQVYSIDLIAPTVDTFTATSPSSSLDIPITAYTASDAGGVTGYLITQSSTAPGAEDPGWSGGTPLSYSVVGPGTYTLYPWARDAAGNVSTVFGSPRSVTVCYPSVTVGNNTDSGAGSLRQAIAGVCTGGTITFDNDYTITLASQLEIINKTITITGAGHHITISGNNAVRVFYVGQPGGSGNLTLDHLNIVNGASKVDECAGSAVSCGGGLMLEYLTTATVSNSTFSNNDGGIEGGAIYSYYGNPLTVTNSTFVNNHALAYAGAIQVFYGNATLTNNTFTGNSATLAGGYGGAILNSWGTVTFRNNIFASNSATNGGNCNNSGGTFDDGGGNLVWGDTSYCPGENANPLLGTLGDYGGLTPTIPLLPGSAAIGAASANCPAVDERGIARGATCNSGAFESQGFTLVKTGGDDQSAPVNAAFAQPLTLGITNVHGEPVDGGTVTFTPPGSGASAGISGSPATIAGGVVSVNATANSTVGGPYSVDASAAGATGVNFSLTNDKINTTTTLVSSSNPATYGHGVTFTAHVSSGSGTPTGTVQFKIDGTDFGTPAALSGNDAVSGTISTLTAGPHTVTSFYSGDANYKASDNSASPLMQTVSLLAPPTIAASFGATAIPLNGSTSLGFTLTNPAANSQSLTGIAFADTLPAGLTVATPNGLTGNCGGTVTADAGSGSVSLAGGTIPPNGSCTFSINVTGTVSGSYTNTTGSVSSIESGPGGTASASIKVNMRQLSIAFSGNGSGTVTSTAPDSAVNCIKGSSDGCNADYPLGTSVTLAAIGNWKSLFTGWSGGVTSSDTPVTFTMDANMTVTATFDPNNKAKLIPGDALFASIQDAYASVASGSLTIQAQEWSFLEELIFGNGTAVILTGGMDTSYNPTSGYATVKSLTVETGSAVIENITIK